MLITRQTRRCHPQRARTKKTQSSFTCCVKQVIGLAKLYACLHSQPPEPVHRNDSYRLYEANLYVYRGVLVDIKSIIFKQSMHVCTCWLNYKCILMIITIILKLKVTDPTQSDRPHADIFVTDD